MIQNQITKLQKPETFMDESEIRSRNPFSLQLPADLFKFDLLSVQTEDMAEPSADHVFLIKHHHL